jgi:kynurenine formamidase
MVAKALLNPREDNRMSQLLAGSPKNWGRWGPDDQVGGLNFLTSAEILRGARAIRQGKVITCGEVIGSPTGDPIFPGRTQPQRANTQDFGDYQSGKKNPLPGGIQYADDQITMFLQGSTQYDALGHVWYDDQLWNGYSASETVGGMKKASILPIAERGVVGRGVLLDMAAYRGKFALEKGDTVNLDDLLGAAKKQGVAIEKHDILCLRIGFLQLLHTQGPEEFYANFNEPGLIYSPELVDWFQKMEIPALCTDTISNEMDFDPETGMQVTLHCALMRNLGVLFNEICNFEALAKDCHEDGQWDFLYVGAPLKVHLGTGAPLNVVAIK